MSKESVPVTVEPFLSRYSEGFDLPVRGDVITPDRYISRDYMELENKNLWPRVWHLGGLIAELEEEGDFVRHNLAKESAITAGSSRQTAFSPMFKMRTIFREAIRAAN